MARILLMIALTLIAFALAMIVILYDRRIIFTGRKRASKGIVNHDTFMTSFVYRVDLTAAEVFEKLRVPNINDGMKYALSEDRKTITFMMDPGQIEPCDLHLEPCGKGCLLRVRRTRPFAVNNVRDLPYLMDPFWINKVQAEPVAYSGRV